MKHNSQNLFFQTVGLERKYLLSKLAGNEFPKDTEFEFTEGFKAKEVSSGSGASKQSLISDGYTNDFGCDFLCSEDASGIINVEIREPGAGRNDKDNRYFIIYRV